MSERRRLRAARSVAAPTGSPPAVDLADMPERLRAFRSEDWDPGPIPEQVLAVMRASVGGNNPTAWRYHRRVLLWTEAREQWAAARGLTERDLPGTRPRRHVFAVE
jgi:hypothetical protein